MTGILQSLSEFDRHCRLYIDFQFSRYPYQGALSVYGRRGSSADTNADMGSESTQVELEPKRVMIGDTDNGKKLLQMIDDLKALLQAYRQGIIIERRDD